MKRYIFLGMSSILLHGEFISEATFIASIAEVFSITLSTRTLSADLGSGTPGVMGTFDATLTDTTTPPPSGVNYVKMYSITTDPDDNAKIQMVRVTNLGSTPADPNPPPTIDIVVLDNLDTSGNPVGGAGRVVENNDNLRVRVRTPGNTYTNEVHTLTVRNNPGDSNMQGNYRTMLYFQLETP